MTGFTLTDIAFPLTSVGFSLDGIEFATPRAVATSTTAFKLRSDESLFWVAPGKDQLPAGYVPSGVACVLGGALVYIACDGSERTVHVSAGAVFRARLTAVAWDRTTATVYAIVRPAASRVVTRCQ